MSAKKKPDRRTQRTRHNLTHAMVELIQEKRFDDITVQNVIERADVGRATFYSHFTGKEDLFQKNWERFLDFCAQQIDWGQVGKGSFIPVLFLFAFQERHGIPGWKDRRRLEGESRAGAVNSHSDSVEFFGQPTVQLAQMVARRAHALQS